MTTETTNKKFYVIVKTVPGNVFFSLSPIDNSNQTRVIKLTDEMPKARLPRNWALGVFLNQPVFRMFEKGVFTFEELDTIVADAIQEQVYFGDKQLDFKAAEPNTTQIIENILKEGNKDKIDELFRKHRRDSVMVIAKNILSQLTMETIKMLEERTGIQLVVENA